MPFGLVGVHWNVTNPAPSVTDVAVVGVLTIPGRSAVGKHPVEGSRCRDRLHGPGHFPTHTRDGVVEAVGVGRRVVELANVHRRGAELEGSVTQRILELGEIRFEVDVVGGDVEGADPTEDVRAETLMRRCRD